MKFFIDSANIAEIKEAAELGILDGVTTNPSLVAKEGRDFKTVIREICAVCAGPVSAEVTRTDAAGMIEEGLDLAKIAPQVTIKVPLTKDGLKACKFLRGKNIMVNVTLCFSATQALLAAKAEASFISPFIGRLDDISQTGMDLIREIRTIYTNYGFKTEILAASIRHPIHVKEAAMVGADVATMPFKVFDQLVSHPLTDSGLAKFLADWQKMTKK